MDDESRRLIREEYDAAKDENSKLKEQVKAAQNKYMDKAESRLGVQAAMSKILNMVNSTNNQKLIDGSYNFAEKAEKDAKALLEQLGQEQELGNLDQSERLSAEAPRSQLEDNLRKYNDHNVRMKKDVKNRADYYDAECKIKTDYEEAIDKVVKLLAANCEDKALVERVKKAQATAALL